MTQKCVLLFFSGHPIVENMEESPRLCRLHFGGRLLGFLSVLACTGSARTAASLKLGRPGGLDFSQAASRASSLLWRRTPRNLDAFPDSCVEGRLHMNCCVFFSLPLSLSSLEEKRKREESSRASPSAAGNSDNVL